MKHNNVEATEVNPAHESSKAMFKVALIVVIILIGLSFL